MKVTDKLFNYIAGLVIALVALVVYSNSFKVPLQFDDIYHVQHKPLIHDLDNFSKVKAWSNIGERPLAMFTMALNYRWGKEEVTGYHVMNLVIHILAGWVAYFLALQLMSVRGLKTKEWLVENKNLMALMVALIFVAHPMQTQAVTYIIQRITALAGLFYMLTVLMYLKARLSHLDRGLTSHAIRYYIFTAISFVLAMLSKQIAVTAPLTLILTEAFFVRDQNGNIQKKFLYYFSGAVAIFVILGLIVVGLPRETEEYSRGVYFITNLKVMVKYIQMMFLPIGQNLDHDIAASSTLFGGKELVSLAILLGILYLGYYLYKKDRLISYGIFWFFLTLSVESTIIPIRDFMFEHRMYLPSFGFILAVSAALCYIPSMVSFGKKKVPMAAMILAVLLIGAGAAAYARNKVWQSGMSLWSDAMKKSPNKARPYMWVGVAYVNQKDYEKAKENFDKCIELQPDFSMAYYNRGNVYKELEENQKAIQDYTKAIELKKNYEMAYFNRGVVLAKVSKRKEAINDYNKTIELNPYNALAYYNRGNAYRLTKNYEQAISDYDNAVRLDPNYALAIYNRGLTKAAMDDHAAALTDFDKAIALDSRNYLYYNGKGVSQNALKLFTEAIVSYNTCISMNPKFGQAYYNRAYTKFFGLQDKDAACEDWKMSAGYGYKPAERMLRDYCNLVPASK